MDWVKTDRSTFNQLYKEIGGIEGQKYQENEEVRGDLKEQWEKLRCKNIGKTEKRDSIAGNARSAIRKTKGKNV